MSKHQHYWLTTGVPHPLVFLNHKYRYDCSVCNKQKFFRHAPVNPVLPSAWEVYEQSDKRFAIAPPMMLGPEPDYATGARYAALVKEQS